MGGTLGKTLHDKLRCRPTLMLSLVLLLLLTSTFEATSMLSQDELALLRIWVFNRWIATLLLGYLHGFLDKSLWERLLAARACKRRRTFFLTFLLSSGIAHFSSVIGVRWIVTSIDGWWLCISLRWCLFVYHSQHSYSISHIVAFFNDDAYFLSVVE